MADRVTLPANAERVLTLLVERGPMKVKDMAAPLGVTESTVFRMMKILDEHGLVSTALDGIKAASRAGRAWLSDRVEDYEVEPRVPIDAFRHAPSLLHRIGLELGLCAVVVRQARIGDGNCWANLLIIGPPGAHKTSIGRAVIVAAGGGKLVEIAVPSGRAILLRRDHRGMEVMRCELLKELVVVFDELEKVKDGVVKMTVEQMYMHGTDKVTLPDLSLDVNVTTVAVMNERGPLESGFETRTGLHESLERRVVWIDLIGWTPPDHLIGVDWVKALANADAARTVKLPKPRNPTLNVAQRFKKTLSLIVRDSAVISGDRLDCMLWSNLAAASTAWFASDEEAFRFVVWAWARLADPRGVLRKDWELRLRQHFAPRKTAEELARLQREEDVTTLLDVVKRKWADSPRRVAAMLNNDGLRRLRAEVRAKLEGDYDGAAEYIDLVADMKKHGITVETMQQVMEVLIDLGIQRRADRIIYLLALGHLSRQDGSRVHMPECGRDNPSWPYPWPELPPPPPPKPLPRDPRTGRQQVINLKLHPFAG